MERLSRGDGANVTEQRERWARHVKLFLSSSSKSSHGARVNAPSSVWFGRASEAFDAGSVTAMRMTWDKVGWRFICRRGRKSCEQCREIETSCDYL